MTAWHLKQGSSRGYMKTLDCILTEGVDNDWQRCCALYVLYCAAYAAELTLFHQAEKPARTSNLLAPIMLLTGHSGDIFTARFHPEGQFLVSSGFDRQICECLWLWNSEKLLDSVRWLWIPLQMPLSAAFREKAALVLRSVVRYTTSVPLLRLMYDAPSPPCCCVLPSLVSLNWFCTMQLSLRFIWENIVCEWKIGRLRYCESQFSPLFNPYWNH